MKIAGVAILDMQMSKVPIISGYDENRKKINGRRTPSDVKCSYEPLTTVR
jgi:hypothetical protein